MTMVHDVIRTPAGVALAFDSVGEGRPILLLHGGGQTRHSWAKTAQRLAAAGYRAICIDARGHGDSAWTPRYSLPLFAEDLRGVMAWLGPDTAPAVIGASLGGLTAVLALGAADAPRASALVLVDIATKIKQQGAGQIRTFMSSNQDGFASLEEAADAVSRYMTDRPRPKNVDGLRKNLRLRDGRYYWHWDPSFMTGGTENIGGERGRADIDGAAARLTLPTLLVRGEHSKIIDADSISHFRSLVPHVEVTEVGGAGHMVAGDVNTPFADTITDFLKRHYPS